MCLFVTAGAVVTAPAAFKAAAMFSAVNVVLLSGFAFYFVWLTFKYAEWACDAVRERLDQGESAG